MDKLTAEALAKVTCACRAIAGAISSDHKRDMVSSAIRATKVLEAALKAGFYTY